MRVDEPALSIVAIRLRAGQPFSGKGLDDFPAALELVDIGDELKDLRRNNDAVDGVHARNTQFHPILPNSHPRQDTTQFHLPYYPIRQIDIGSSY